MIFICGGKELEYNVKKWDFETTLNLDEADLMVVEIPQFLNEITYHLPTMVVVKGLVNYSDITDIQEAGGKIVTSEDLQENLRRFQQQIKEEKTKKYIAEKQRELEDARPPLIKFDSPEIEDRNHRVNSTRYEEDIQPKDFSPHQDHRDEYDRQEESFHDEGFRDSASSAESNPYEHNRKKIHQQSSTENYYPSSNRKEDPGVSRSYRTRLGSCKILASFSTKGGVGKTAVATNLAAIYASQGKRVILIDFDIGTGNAADVLGIAEEAFKGPTTDDWFKYPNLPEHLKKHPSSGIYLLPAGDNMVSEEDVEGLLENLSGFFDYIILDFGTSPFMPHAKTGLEIAEKVYIVALQEQGMLQALVRFLNQKREWIEDGKAVLVINKVNPAGYYKPEQVAKITEFKEYKIVPEDINAFEAAKRAGKAVVQLKGSEAAKALEAIALGKGSNYSEDSKDKKGFLGKLRGR